MDVGGKSRLIGGVGGLYLDMKLSMCSLAVVQKWVKSASLSIDSLGLHRPRSAITLLSRSRSTSAAPLRPSSAACSATVLVGF